MKNAFAAALAVAGLAAAAAHAEPWHPPAGATELALWPADRPLARPEVTGEERVEVGKEPIGGRSVTVVHDVARPTMAIFPPKGANTGAAVLVFPGGGYRILAIDLEGTDVCDWLTANGITCAVLKYRVPQTWWPPGCHCQRPPKELMALEDAERAMGLLRGRAHELGIDPHKIGVLGFSAGGHMVAQISNARSRSYAPVDAADRQSIRPDFAVALYPGHLWAFKDVDLYPWNEISANAPPTFIAQAEDDPVDDVRNSIAYFLALREAKVPVEMHIYAHGAHAFGARRTAQPITGWPDLVEKWLRTIGIVSQ